MTIVYTDIDDVTPPRITSSVNPRVEDADDSICIINRVRQSTDIVRISFSLNTLANKGLCLVPYTIDHYDPVTMLYTYILAYPIGKNLFARFRFVTLAVRLDDKLIAECYKIASKSFRKNCVKSNIVSLNYHPEYVTRAELKDIILNLKSTLDTDAFNTHISALAGTIKNCVRLTPVGAIRIRDDILTFRIDLIIAHKHLEDTYSYITNTLKCIPEFKIIL